MINELYVDLAIIGGGPAGLAAAIEAKLNGVDNILILERDRILGGILNQCIHNGFGLHTFNEELTGPEYANRFIQRVDELGIEYKLNTMVCDISFNKEQENPDTNSTTNDALYKHITAMNSTDGLFYIKAKAVILAMGCRERPRGALNIPGYRPAGIYSAGTAQKLVNIDGYMPGKEVVILGSGDIGLIMARRLRLEGANVKVVAELMPYSGGLKRNIVQCLDDFGIPLKLSHTVTNIKGKTRVEGITLSQVDSNGKPIPGTEEDISCDTLLLSCGLLPENELSRELGVSIENVTNGPTVNESFETNIPGVFACGNVLHVHDLVDFVSEEAANAGKNAARYIKEPSYYHSENPSLNNNSDIRINTENGVRYTVPQTINVNRIDKDITLRFRVGGVYKNCYETVYFNDKQVIKKKRPIVAPGEMEELILSKSMFEDCGSVTEITVKIEN